ncbi:hypothetical protein A3A46_01895 [Candidatus Roizmanbacteria bacterium RIFCSPLOWO2_01_FULL_37_13]|uniref:Glycosyltransferase 2-like domain-containing protein n=1 Tax=Candidatus Roizmanbacteria bacterium RIFCSPHIGHO2_02_FULL_38_11 TaxID=1802039 RepID=A0A1F7GZG3_9BACT|nr:MAG: hypothetical protein A3C25_05755 [Candidatus Roizmanbacteria bacterium RIFCSPHIGHO2_02_FULL_38_11]OGK34964.1 MAG: hypothetical protein A3F58_00350 [Candidatus Roizmanbacteria bacterium RIFCSPHIGHO2_12_FULL_37_9b]OGK42976.1 MAG: hypothetical protein A3A46_01895 [Candidatus Roizmanbacteria bacterium RIFCSPLOWO2_01_FULL_37_13]
MLSIVIPFYNEADSLPVLINQLIDACNKVGKEYEIVLVDDGSNDNSKFKIKNAKLQLKSQNYQIKILEHIKRLGKGQALVTGIKEAKGDIIIFMDADLQDDPEDLPKFLKKIEDGYDFANGVRTGRKDSSIIKSYSALAKYFLRLFLGSPFADINCGFKAFKREVLSDFTFYGNNFRFFPLAVFYNGYKVAEVEVKNNPRLFGKSKFGSGKLVVGIFDTLTAYFIYKFAEQPLHFFGAVGSLLFSAGFLISIYLTIERLFFGVLLYQRPVLWLGLSLIIVGIQVIMTGIIGELIVYISKKNPKS